MEQGGALARLRSKCTWKNNRWGKITELFALWAISAGDDAQNEFSLEGPDDQPRARHQPGIFSL